MTAEAPQPADPADPRPIERRVDLGTARLLPDLDRPRGWLLTLDDETVDLAAVLGGNIRKAPAAASEPDSEPESLSAHAAV